MLNNGREQVSKGTGEQGTVRAGSPQRKVILSAGHLRRSAGLQTGCRAGVLARTRTAAARKGIIE